MGLDEFVVGRDLGALSVFAATSAEPCKLVSSSAKDKELAIFHACSWVMRAEGSGKRPDGLVCRILSIALRN